MLPHRLRCGVVLTGAPRRQRWERHSQVPLALLGLVFIVCYSIVVLETDPTRVFRQVAGVIFAIAFVAFAIDYVVQIALSPAGARWQFVIRNPLHLLAVLLPVFRAVRVVDLLRRIRYFHRRNGTAVRAEVAVFAAMYALVFVYFLALATLQVERPVSGARIVTFEDAVWWAFETLSTVGYGDMYPVTGLGRLYAVLLMMGGVVIIGVVSGTVVSYITDRIRSRERTSHPPDGTRTSAAGDPASRMIVRPAAPEDARSLAVLDASAWPRELQVVAPQPATAPFFTGRRTVEDVLIAELDDVTVGYAHLARHLPIDANRHVIHLNAIAVSPNARRRGVATALLSAAVAEARSRGARKLGLRALSINGSAIAMYERHGFQQEGRLRDEILLPDGSYADDLWYALFLDEQPSRTRDHRTESSG